MLMKYIVKNLYSYYIMALYKPTNDIAKNNTAKSKNEKYKTSPKIIFRLKLIIYKRTTI